MVHEKVVPEDVGAEHLSERRFGLLVQYLSIQFF